MILSRKWSKSDQIAVQKKKHLLGSTIIIMRHLDLRESLRLPAAASASVDPSPDWADSIKAGASLP